MSLSISTVSEDVVSNTDNITALWEIVHKALLIHIKDANTVTWLEAITPVSLENGCATLGAPTRFARDWIKNNLSKQIFDELKQIYSSLSNLEFVIGRKKDTPSKKSQNNITKDETDSKTVVSIAQAKVTSLSVVKPNNTIGSEPEDDVFDSKYTFSNFVVGTSNELAYAAARKVADGRSVTFNPLFFHGGVGLGKTHLMHAIALEIKEKHPERRVIYLSAEQFMHRFVTALRNYDMQSFKEEFRNLDVLLIDDLQFISGKNSTQEEFFHTFNALVDSKKQIVISADRSPNDMGNMEERIRSRLSWGLVVDIHQTDYSLRIGILKSKIELLQIEYPSFFVPDKVIEYLAHHITGNVRELEGAINRIAAHSTFTGRPVTMEVVEDVISDLIRMYERKITITEIQKKTSEYYGIKIDDLKSSRRSRDVARPRQIAMFLVKTLTGHSFPEIGRKFGGKDHTTVLHAVRRIEELLTQDKELVEQINEIKMFLKTSQ